jgi:hypothetical protein
MRDNDKIGLSCNSNSPVHGGPVQFCRLLKPTKNILGYVTASFGQNRLAEMVKDVQRVGEVEQFELVVVTEVSIAHKSEADL